MKWAYVLVFDQSVATKDELVKFIDAQPEIQNWSHCMTNAIFLVSTLTANGLQQRISDGINKNGGYFIILDAKTDKNGWLPKASWEFLNNPKGVLET
jgi:hypothetical protein